LSEVTSFRNGNLLLPPFIVQSVHYKTISTTDAVEPKILHYLVHVLQSNIPINTLRTGDADLRF